jgi:hypothetical protein
MISYKKLQYTETIPWDLIVSWYNKVMLRRLVTKVAWNQHLVSGREVHISEMFGSFVVFDSRDREDLNKSGKVSKMNVYDLMRASIWNSTAHSGIVKRKQIIKYPTNRKKNIKENSK